MVEKLFHLNCSTLFLLRPLGLSRKQLEGTGFINCYLQDRSKPEYEGLNVVFLMFRPKSAERFRYFVDREKNRTSLLFDEYDLEDSYTVLVYEFPEELADDFEVFKKGKYSKFSSKYLNFIPKQVTVNTDKGYQTSHTVQWMIIGQTEEWKDILEREWNIKLNKGMEMWNAPNFEEETIHIPPKKIAPEK